jgi:predicted TPR repeat methyltransferase
MNVKPKFFEIVSNHVKNLTSKIKEGNTIETIKNSITNAVAEVAMLKKNIKNIDGNNYKLAIHHFTNGQFKDVRFRFWMLKKLGHIPPDADFFIGASYFFEDDFQNAKPYLENFLNSNPGQLIEETNFCLNVINKEYDKIQGIPLEFIKIKYDYLSTRYDQLLMNKWQDSPQFLFYLMTKEYLEKVYSSNKRFRVLDLGCGNGILGRFCAVEGFANYLVGVDLSPKMLNLAYSYILNDTNIYDTLELNSIQAFLKNNTELFEIAAMCLSLNLIKDPSQIFTDIKRSLTQEGLLVLLFKNQDNPGTIFEPVSLEFVHNESNIQSILESCDFEIAVTNYITLLDGSQGSFIIAKVKPAQSVSA